MEHIRIVITYQCKSPALADAFLQKLVQGSSTTKQEPGCLQIDLGKSSIDPARVFLIELWQDRALFDLHWAKKLTDSPGWVTSDEANYEFYVHTCFEHHERVWRQVLAGRRSESIRF